MTIKVNNEPVELTDNVNVAHLIEFMKIATGGLAVACNGVIVKRENWEAHQLHPGDEVLIIKAAYGG